MHKRLLGWAALLLLAVSSAFAQQSEPTMPFRRHFIGSSGFVLFNALPNPPAFYQLNYGYWLTRKDVVSVEAKTWRYAYPLGIPYGKSFESPAEEYPGYVSSYGLAAVYQRYFWKGLYSAVHAAALRQRYVNEETREIRRGFQLFLTFRAGYHIRIRRDRFFLEPSVAVTHWPVNTNVPEAFARRERQWPTYFLFEPGMHFGVKF